MKATIIIRNFVQLHIKCIFLIKTPVTEVKHILIHQQVNGSIMR